MILNGQQRKWLFALMSLVLITSGYIISHLQYSYRFEDFFPVNDPAVKYYDSVRTLFTHGDEVITIGITAEQHVFDTSFLKELTVLENNIRKLDGVTHTSSIISLKNYIKTLTGIKEVPFLHLQDPKKLQRDTTRLFNYPDVHPKFVSRDRKSTCLFLSVNEGLPTAFDDQLLQLVEDRQFVKYHVYGHNITINKFKDQLQKEVILLTSVAVILISLIILLSFRTSRILMITLIFIACTVLITLGFMELIGAKLNILTVTIPTIVAILSMSDLIHVFSRLQDFEAPDLAGRIRMVYKDLNRSLLLTSVTTAVGFGSLVITGIIPFVYFGVITAFGILVAYLLTIFLLPELIRVFYVSHHFPTIQKAVWFIRKLEQVVTLHPRKIVIGSVIILLLSGFYGRNNHVNALVYDDLGSDDPLSETLQFFETNFFGIRDMNLFIEIRGAKNVLDEEILVELNKIEEFLHNDFGATSAYGFATLAKRYNRIYYRGIPEKYEIPRRKEIRTRLIQAFEDFEPKTVLHAVITPDKKFTQIMVKSRDWGSKVNSKKLEKLNTFLHTEIDRNLLDVKVTGESIFIDKSNELIARYLFYSLVGAVFIVFIIMGFVHLSWRTAFFCTLVNIFPMVLLLGIMYWFDIRLNKSTAVVFTIAFGLAVDDTIHFVSRVHTNLSRSNSLLESVLQSIRYSGKAIFITSIILIGGFGVLMFSSFQSTFLTGSLVSLCLVFALIGDLLFLPALLLIGSKGK